MQNNAKLPRENARRAGERVVNDVDILVSMAKLAIRDGGQDALSEIAIEFSRIREAVDAAEKSVFTPELLTQAAHQPDTSL